MAQNTDLDVYGAEQKVCLSKYNKLNSPYLKRKCSSSVAVGF